MAQTLKVKPVGTALVHDFERPQALGDHQRYVGRVWDEASKGYAPVAEPVEVPCLGEYVMALRDGDLEPADAETARVAGVPFKAATKRAAVPQS